MKNNIEVELRSLLNEKQFLELKKILKKEGKYLGKDDKETHFFLFPDKLLKVTNNISKGDAKISLKLQKIGIGSDFEETEIFFPSADTEKMVQILKLIGCNDYQYSYQNRQNYLYKNIEFAIKYTASWGFHCEMEIMVNSKSDIQKAIDKITSVSSELGIKIMTNDELKNFTDKIDHGWTRGKQNHKYLIK